jgi:anti-sigma factor RsiW
MPGKLVTRWRIECGNRIMQGMDCRNFKELLDSYLSDELAVETNHACLRHAEQCPACRAEMGARRNLRSALRQACQQTVLSFEAHARLRACLRAADAKTDANIEAAALPARRRSLTRPNWLSLRLAYSLAAAMLLATGWLTWSTLNRNGIRVPLLSETVLAEAAGDHRTCAAHFAGSQAAAITPLWMKEKHPAYAQLAEVAAEGAQGLELKSVHVCKFQGRQFGHLVYAQEGQLISLLVTPRDGSCLRGGQVPTDDGRQAGLQHSLSDACQVSAYQTAKYVVLVVSDFPEAENQQLAVRLAAPVSAHLRQIEKSIAWVSPLGTDAWLAQWRGQMEQASVRRERIQ